MSFWINKMACRKCGTEINVAGGMVQQTWMGPADKDLKCLNDKCDGVGYDNFKLVAERDSIMTPEGFKEYVWLKADCGCVIYCRMDEGHGVPTSYRAEAHADCKDHKESWEQKNAHK